MVNVISKKKIFDGSWDLPVMFVIILCNLCKDKLWRGGFRKRDGGDQDIPHLQNFADDTTRLMKKI